MSRPISHPPNQRKLCNVIKDHPPNQRKLCNSIKENQLWYVWPYNKQIVLSSFENFEQNGKTADWNACGDSNYVKNMGKTCFPIDV